MVSMWYWVGTRVGRRALQRSDAHIELIIEVAKSALQLFKCFKDDDVGCIQEMFNKVFNYEREADNVKRSIFEELSNGFIHPIDRDEIVRLVLATDDIAAYLKAASRRALLVDPKIIDYEIKIYALTMCEKVLNAVGLLKEAVRSLPTEPNKALAIANDVERIEEEIDDIRMRALERVLRFCNHTEVSACIIAKEIIDSLENSADRCEDTADVIRVLAVLRA
ncbi:MAG: DUF47 family protein [Sulfolobales archaeon]